MGDRSAVEPFDPFSEWLGRRGDRPPQDHYELLGLARFEPDLALISQTADSLRAKIRKIRPGPHVAHWQRLLDRLEAAKICLSDPITKAAYDESIDSTPQTPHVSDRPAVTTDSSATRSNSAGYAAPAGPQFDKAPPVTGDVRQNDSSMPRASENALYPSVQPVRRKSSASRLAVHVLVATTVLLLIAIGWVVVKQKTDAAQATVSPHTSPNATSPVEKPKPSQNLPQAEPAALPSPAPSPVEVAPKPLPPPMASIPVSPLKPSAAIAPPPSPTTSVPAPGPTVDPARQQAFGRAIALARSALADRDLDAAATHLNEAVSLAQTEQETADAEQVEVLRAHLDAFWGSLLQQIPRLESGSELRVAEMMVVVVEAGTDFLTLRVSGQNHRYSTTGMPYPLVVAMAEQLLSKSPNAKALLAAFLIADAGGNTEKAWQLLQDASQGGAEVSELLSELNRPK